MTQNYDEVRFGKVVDGIEGDVLRQSVRNRRRCIPCIGKYVAKLNHLENIIFGISVSAEEACDLPYVKSDKVLRDRSPNTNETYIKSLPGKQSTNVIVKGAKAYKDSDSRYHHVDTLHVGLSSEVEVYDKFGKHIGSNYPDGTPKGGPVPGRSINIK